jgi:ribose 1,5-bisphosphokinase
MPAADRQGTLVLVVGPSGAGKDTLIDHARDRLGKEPGFAFVQRAITRPAGAGEDHEAISEDEFERRLAAGAFSLHWRAHGLGYGLPAAIDGWLDAGTVVVANGSRAMLEEARHRFPKLLVVNVTAPPEVLAKRLAGRGRESEADIGERLAAGGRHEVLGTDVIALDNSGPPAVAGEALTVALRRLAPQAVS